MELGIKRQRAIFIAKDVMIPLQNGAINLQV